MFFLHHHDSHSPQVLNLSKELSDMERFGLSIHEQRDLSIGRNDIQKTGHVRFLPLNPEDRIGFELGNHMITTPSTDLRQGFCPVPAIGQDIEFTRDGQDQGSDDLFCQSDFGLKGATPPCSFWMIELRPQRQKRFFVEQGRQDPLMTKDTGPVLGRVLMPTTARNLLPCLFNQGIIHDKKEDISGRDPQGLEELMQSRFSDFLHLPNVLAQKASEAGERSMQERTGKGLDHRGSVDFFPQLDETDNKGREEFKRRS